MVAGAAMALDGAARSERDGHWRLFIGARKIESDQRGAGCDGLTKPILIRKNCVGAGGEQRRIRKHPDLFSPPGLLTSAS
jgi:hypothetical protein